MPHLNIEIKARCPDQDTIREILKENKADFKGIDHQIDTYFKVKQGRLKLRNGNIENSLVYYEREDQPGPKPSQVNLYNHSPSPDLKELLTKSLGILAIVDKRRGIYFIENVKFHLDQVEKLGKFVEIEAIDKEGTIGKDKLYEQCQFYLNLFKIPQENLISLSYSDLLLQRRIKAYLSSGSEMEINLSPEAISDLEKETLKGRVKLFDNLEGTRQFKDRDLEIKVGLLEFNLFVESKSYPSHADFEKIEGYSVTLSPEGYEMLKRSGATGDRTRVPGRVDISRSEYLSEK